MYYQLYIDDVLDPSAVEWAYERVFRKNLQAPGFAILTFRKAIGSASLRENMVALKKGLSQGCRAEFEQALDYYWLTRFDQQNNTRFHRDNAPADAYLLLGYEPTAVESKLLFADHHRFIKENRLPIETYYERYNPLFQEGEEYLAPYTTEVDPLDNRAYHMVVINNSELDSDQTRGVLHKAVMKRPAPDQARMVNSMMLYPVPPDTPARVSPAERRDFLTRQ